MSTAHVVVTRTDIPNGVLQLTDLFPHSSLSNQVDLPEGQTQYLRRAATSWSTVATTGANPILTVNAYTGLAAYLLDNVVSSGLGAGTGALTAANANAASAALLAIVDAGSPLTLAAVNVALSVIAATTGLTTGGSTGVLLELLQIVSGRTYSVPSAASVEAAGVKTARTGSFVDTYWKPVIRGGVFEISNLRGQISKLKASTFPYKGTLAAAVVVLDDSGNVI